MSEDIANDYNWKDKARSVAYSMKLVNGIYKKLIEMFALQMRTEIEDEYARGWNDAISMVIQFTHACRYTKEDFLDLMEEGDDSQHETT